MRSENTDRTVVFVVFPGFQSLDLTGPFEVFSGANSLLDSERRPGPRYQPVVAAPLSGLVTSDSGLTIGATHALSGVPSKLDTLVVVGGHGTYPASNDEHLVGEVRRLARSARRVTSVCTGAFVLAAAGLLDGRTACTHWARADQFAQRFPTVDLDRDSLFRCDGKIWTSAGVTAGIDLALALIAEDHDAELAQVVGRWLVMFYRRPGGQSQFAAPVWRGTSERAAITNVLDSIVADPAGDHRLARLSTSASMSERNFLRVFVREIGVTPAKFVESVRVDAACRALETTEVGVDVIAKDSGFGTAETMRRTFLRTKGVAPSEYRNRFTLRTNSPQL
jgi:transcriptional regulator GlxA family with amidase domain